ncbi:TLDc domain-containing protein [Entamoeba marina]
MNNYNHLTDQVIRTLKEWSGLKKMNVLFDSDVDGDGFGTLVKTVYNKTNLYFISIDDYDDVFGGYLPNVIDKIKSPIKDFNSFVFSLLKDGEVVLNKFPIKQSISNHAFQLYPDYFEALYEFGYDDITAFRINCRESCCDPYVFEYENDKFLVDSDSDIKFLIQRLLVIEMK